MSSSAHNLDAERSVLGAILATDGKALDTVGSLLTPEHFFRKAHEQVYASMLTLYAAGTPIDFVTLSEALTRAGHLESVGGKAFIGTLADGVPRSTNVEYFARIVKDKAILRRTEAAASQLLESTRAYDADAVDVLSQAERALLDLSLQAVPGDVVWADAMAREVYPVLEQLHRERRPVTGVSSGLYAIDRYTRGFQPGDLVIVAGRPSQGKTSIALQFAIQAAREAPVAFFSLEMSRQALEMRIVAALGRVDAHAMLCGQLSTSDQERVGRAVVELSELQLAVDDTPAVTPLQIRSKARRIKAQRGLSMLVVDYLQLMSGGSKFENRTQEVSALSRALKAVARDLHVPALVLSQLSRKAEDRADKRPQLSDLRESGAIEQDADLVLMVHRPAAPDGHQPITELIISKQRNGPIGVIELAFLPEQMRFTEVERR